MTSPDIDASCLQTCKQMTYAHYISKITFFFGSFVRRYYNPFSSSDGLGVEQFVLTVALLIVIMAHGHKHEQSLELTSKQMILPIYEEDRLIAISPSSYATHAKAFLPVHEKKINLHDSLVFQCNSNQMIFTYSGVVKQTNI